MPAITSELKVLDIVVSMHDRLPIASAPVTVYPVGQKHLYDPSDDMDMT